MDKIYNIKQNYAITINLINALKVINVLLLMDLKIYTRMNK
jgi:hypothetical protein